MSPRWLYVPLDVAQTPITGEVIVDCYWSVHAERGVCFHVSPGWVLHPQGNASEDVTRRLTAHLHRDDPHEVRQLSAVYVTHASMELARMREEQRRE